jgi:hypothetical protein
MNKNNDDQWTTVPLQQVKISLENGFDKMFPDNEAAQKSGRLGKCFAANRSSAKKLVLVVCCTLMVLVILEGVYAMIGTRFLAAHGLSNRLSFYPILPWTSEEELLGELIRRTSHDVKIGGQVVTRVIEPMEKIGDVQEIMLLETALNHGRDINAEMIQRGYFKWRPYLGERSEVNFTLEHVYQLVRRDVLRDNDSDCVCYVEYGLPYNVVYLVSNDATLFAPRIDAASKEKLNISSECVFEILVDRFWERMKKTQPQVAEYGDVHLKHGIWTHGNADVEKEAMKKWHVQSKSGTVVYLDQRGAPQRKVFGLPEFPCIEHCIHLHSLLLK